MSEICFIIPTCDRPEAIRRYLAALKEENAAAWADVIIFDSSSDDATAAVVAETNLPGVLYQRYTGPDELDRIDRKVYAAVQMFAPQYRVVGFSSDGTITHLARLAPQLEQLLQQEVSLVVFDNSPTHRQKIYEKPELLFQECCWRMTALGSTFASSEFLLNASRVLPLESPRQKGLWLPMCYFHAANKEPIRALWLEAPSLWSINPQIQNSFWRASGNVLRQWGGIWCDAVDALPERFAAVRAEALLSHDRHQRLFSIKSLLSMREDGNLTQEKVLAFAPYISRVTLTPLWCFNLIVRIPIAPLRWWKRLYHRSRQTC